MVSAKNVNKRSKQGKTDTRQDCVWIDTQCKRASQSFPKCSSVPLPTATEPSMMLQSTAHMCTLNGSLHCFSTLLDGQRGQDSAQQRNSRWILFILQSAPSWIHRTIKHLFMNKRLQQQVLLTFSEKEPCALPSTGASSLEDYFVPTLMIPHRNRLKCSEVETCDSYLLAPLSLVLCTMRL